MFLIKIVFYINILKSLNIINLLFFQVKITLKNRNDDSTKPSLNILYWVSQRNLQSFSYDVLQSTFSCWETSERMARD